MNSAKLETIKYKRKGRKTISTANGEKVQEHHKGLYPSSIRPCINLHDQWQWKRSSAKPVKHYILLSTSTQARSTKQIKNNVGPTKNQMPSSYSRDLNNESYAQASNTRSFLWKLGTGSNSKICITILGWFLVSLSYLEMQLIKLSAY